MLVMKRFYDRFNVYIGDMEDDSHLIGGKKWLSYGTDDSLVSLFKEIYKDSDLLTNLIPQSVKLMKKLKV